MNQNMDPNQMNNQQQMGMQQGQDQTQTQVLNLNDVQQTAKQEKKAAQPKKFAIFLFLLGVLAIVGGVSYNNIASMLGLTPTEANESSSSSKEKDTDADTTKEATTETDATSIQCTTTLAGQENGTDVTITYDLPFNKENKLLTYTKNKSILPTTGNATGPVTVNAYKEGYTKIAGYQIPGYTMQVTPTNDGEIAGLQVVLNIDLENLDQEKYNSYNVGDPFSQVDLTKEATKEEVTQKLTALGYTCQ